jgi:hypothetical protein
MKSNCLLYVVIIFIGCNRLTYQEHLERQGEIKCGWYGKLKPDERNKVFPFNQARKVLLISYPNYEIDEYAVWTKPILSDSVVTPWGEKLPPITYKYVQYKPQPNIKYPILDTFKLFNRIYWAYEIIELNQNQRDSLSNLMLNYTTDRKIKYATRSESCCYKPRNAIVFLDKNNVAISNYEICFECGRYKIYPDVFDLCSKIDLFNDFFKQCSIHYGIDSLHLAK